MVFRAKPSAVATELGDKDYVSSTSSACHLSFAIRVVGGDKAAEKNSLWFRKFILAQGIFIGVTKSITLTFPGQLHKVNGLVTKREALTHKLRISRPRRRKCNGVVAASKTRGLVSPQCFHP